MTDTGGAAFPTLGVLAIVDGRLMGDIGDIYAVVSFLVGRPAYTHELPKYGRLAEPILAELFPDMAGKGDKPWQEVRDASVLRHGDTVMLPEKLRASLQDGEGPISNLIAALAARTTGTVVGE